MEVISIFNNKGGVGKTTSAVNIAAALAESGNKVLIIDLDAQANATKYLGSAYPFSEGASSILSGKNTSIQLTSYKNIWLVPADINLIAIEEDLLSWNKYSEKEKQLFNYLNKKDNNSFDYVILDCPPSIGIITINALVASTSVLIPIKISRFDLDGFVQLFNVIENIKKDHNEYLTIAGVFITMDRKIKFFKEIKKELKDELGDLLFNQTISLSAAVSKSTFEQKPVVVMSKNCKAAKEYRSLVEELLCHI